MIKEIAFVVYPVTDMPRARSFYEKTLGLAPGETFGESWIEYDVAGAAFAITNGFGDGTPASSVAFEVADLEAELARLKELGVPVEGGINEFEPCRMALIKDPDGNTLCLHQRKR
jgi:predicted enzyme related to lactoylglutathione lyase